MKNLINKITGQKVMNCSDYVAEKRLSIYPDEWAELIEEKPKRKRAPRKKAAPKTEEKKD